MRCGRVPTIVVVSTVTLFVVLIAASVIGRTVSSAPAPGYPLSMPHQDFGNIRGFALYPGAKYAGGVYSTSQNYGEPIELEGVIFFSSLAGPEQIEQFYRNIYGVQVSRAASQARCDLTMVVWQDLSACYALVLSKQSRLSFPLSLLASKETGLTLLRASQAFPLLPTRAKRPFVPPETLRLPVYPQSAIDYSGWSRDSLGAVAVCRSEVVAPNSEVVGYYRNLSAGHRVLRDHSPMLNSRAVCLNLQWQDIDAQYGVVVLQPSEDLPAVIWLQRRAAKSTQ